MTSGSLPTRAGPAQARPSVSAIPLMVAGNDPEALSMCWGEMAFSSGGYYEVLNSTTGLAGSFVPVQRITDDTDVCYWSRTAPGATAAVWWEVNAYASVLGIAVLIGESNEVVTTQPAVAYLWVAWVNDTTAALSWTNNAAYGGNISFGSYWVYDGSSFLGYASSQSFRATVAPQNAYSFSVTTADMASPSTRLTSTSNSVAGVTPVQLLAHPSVSRTTADVTQTVMFACWATGGISPYSFAWAFGDGANGTGTPATHAYSTTGSMKATCSATDSLTTVAAANLYVVVTALPTVSTPISSGGAGVLAGKTVTLSVQAGATAGPGTLSYVWNGLPSGCSSQDAPTISCAPTGAGSFAISVTVTDMNGGNTTSLPLAFTVHPSFLGLPANEGYAVLGAVLVAAGVAGYVAWSLVTQRRRKPTVVPA